MATRIHILVAESSQVLRGGMMAILRRLANLPIEVAEIWEVSDLAQQLVRYRPDVLVVNPAELGTQTPDWLREQSGLTAMKVVALQHTQTPAAILREYDAAFSVYDSLETLREILLRFIQEERSEEDPTDLRQKLTAREKEIVVCVVKGMTNKQIADQLFLSTHTVMTHRKNIASKLQIHSPAGLTIYAIVNKLVDIDEIK